MDLPFLILVSGPPASGKTTLSKRISEDLRVPVYSKDTLKERLFDSIGCNDRELSSQFGRICSETLWYIANSEIKAGKSLILESNFDPEFALTQLKELKSKFPLKVIEIFCNAPKDILIERFIDRVRRGERHPGHCDPTLPELVEQQYFPGDIRPLNLTADCLEFDSTDLCNLKVDIISKTLKDKIL